MKIIHFCESITQGGGIASLVSNLATEQSKDNTITIGVINKTTSNNVSFDSRIQIHYFNKTKQGFSIKYPILIFLYLLKNKFDIVHIHSAFLYYALSIIFLHRRSKFVYTVHSDAQKENNSKWDKRFFWLKKICFKCHYLYPITISPVSKLSFDNLYGIDSHMIENGIRRPIAKTSSTKLVNYRYTNNTLLFLHPGRITEAKNQITLCKVFNKLIKDGNDVVLIIAGVIQDKIIYNELKSFFSNRIIYLGERDDIIDLMCEVDAMCLSSTWEGLPITLLESISVGCIPICTPVGGITNVITHTIDGILSTSTTAEDYYRAVKYFIDSDKATKLRIRNAALARFENYTINNSATKYNNYYKQIISLK